MNNHFKLWSGPKSKHIYSSSAIIDKNLHILAAAAGSPIFSGCHSCKTILRNVQATKICEHISNSSFDNSVSMINQASLFGWHII